MRAGGAGVASMLAGMHACMYASIPVRVSVRMSVVVCVCVCVCVCLGVRAQVTHCLSVSKNCSGHLEDVFGTSAGHVRDVLLHPRPLLRMHACVRAWRYAGMLAYVQACMPASVLATPAPPARMHARRPHASRHTRAHIRAHARRNREAVIHLRAHT